MPDKMIRFRIRNRGGDFAGQTIEHKVPDFDWGLFKNTPNAEAFVKKAYFAAAQKLVRDLKEEKNSPDDVPLYYSFSRSSPEQAFALRRNMPF